jgi:hypothetical protein
MRRVKVFAKGNVDVYDSLHSSRLGGEVTWNGINEVVRRVHPGTLVRLLHETSSRFEALLEADGVVPTDVAARDALLGDYSAASQFSTTMYSAGADAVVLSILPDVAASLARHRADGYLFHATEGQTWPSADREWLEREFVQLEPPDVERSMSHLEGVIARIRASSAAEILVYNLSPVIPGDWVHAYAGLEDHFASRIRRFNVGLIDVSERTGVSIVDVDTVLARAGAEMHKLDVYHLTPTGYRLVAEEVVRILEDLGVL